MMMMVMMMMKTKNNNSNYNNNDNNNNNNNIIIIIIIIIIVSIITVFAGVLFVHLQVSKTPFTILPCLVEVAFIWTTANNLMNSPQYFH